MAGFEGFGGFSFTPSSRIIGEFQQGLKQALTSGNPNQMRAAVMQQAAFTVSGGTPEYKEARKKEAALKEAADRTAAAIDPTADPLEQQAEYFKNAQKIAVEAGLPDIAMQATDKYSQVTLMQEQRNRLKTQDKQEAAAFNMKKEAHDVSMASAKVENLYGTTAIALNPVDNSFIDEVDLLAPGAQEKIKEQAAQGNVVVTMDKYLDISEAEKDRIERQKTLKKSGSGNQIAGRSGLYNKYHTKLIATTDFAISADSFIDVLLDPSAAATFATGGKGVAAIQRLGTHTKNILTAVDSYISATEGRPSTLVSDVKERFTGNGKYNALSENRQALVLELGYALATSREGGRLTDQDVDRAIASLGLQNPDPRAVAYTFGRALIDRKESIANGFAVSGINDIEQSAEATELVVQDLTKVIERLESVYDLDFTDEELDEETKLPKSFGYGSTQTVVPRSGDAELAGVRELNENGQTIVQVP